MSTKKINQEFPDLPPFPEIPEFPELPPFPDVWKNQTLKNQTGNALKVNKKVMKYGKKHYIS